MTDQAVKEATRYVEQSIESQAKLGYKRPPKTVVRAAIKEAAVALENLRTLKKQ